MSISLDGKKVLVTGGTRGIGRAIVLTLARAGADVLTCYQRESEAVEQLTAELKELPGDHHAVRADLGTAEGVTSLIEQARTRFGSLDVVVNNAGVISHVPFDKLALEEWQRVLDVNLTAAFSVTQQALPLLGEGASVVNVGSKVATVGIPMRAHYTDSKAGLIGLSRSLCKELGPRGIRVNVVAPGIIDTSDAERLTPEEHEQMQQRLAAYKQRCPLGRLGRPDEVANAVLFLASDLSTYVTGDTITVDGGL